MWRHVALVREEVLEERVGSIIKVDKMITLFLAGWFFPLMMEAIHFSEKSILTRAKWLHMQEDDDILHSHRRKYLTSHIHSTSLKSLKMEALFFRELDD
jgi:hypothetical protein